MKHRQPRYVKAAIVTAIISALSFGLSTIGLLAWQYILIIASIYFIWEAFLEHRIIGEER